MFNALGVLAIGQADDSEEAMAILTSAELAAMQGDINQLMPDTCNICSITNAADSQGGVTTTRGTVGTAITCRLDMEQGRELLTGGAIQPYTRYILSMPYDTDVLPAYIIEFNSTDYYVKSVNLDQSWKAVVRVELERA